jgi:LemA protein
MSAVIIILVALVVVLLWGVATYNRLVKLTIRAQEAFQDIEVQLKRRYDLIPNLVETVKGYAAHEQGTLDKVIQARAAAMKGGSLAERAAEENMLSDTLKSIFALSESYPDLKANQNFLKLQDELADTENKIQAARRFYNGNVRDLNEYIQTVPSNIIAKLFHFTSKEFFDIPDDSAAQQPVAVKF